MVGTSDSAAGESITGMSDSSGAASRVGTSVSSTSITGIAGSAKAPTVWFLAKIVNVKLLAKNKNAKIAVSLAKKLPPPNNNTFHLASPK